MKWYYGCWVVLLLFLMPGFSTANDLENMYGEPQILRELSRFESFLDKLVSIGIWPHLSDDEQRALADVSIELPTEGYGPMGYYSIVQGGQPYVVLPMLSLLFLEDLCTAYAWLWANNYSLETVDEYVTMLKYKKAVDFPGRRYPQPLQALQIPNNALSDPKVDEMSLRFRNSAIAFILLHELGHLLYGHPGYEGITLDQARENEENADRFALEVLQRTGTIPMGALLFFQAQAYMMPNKGQFIAEGHYRSEEDWELYLYNTLTHPVTTRRLELMALHLDQTADRTGAGAERDTLRYIGSRLMAITEILEDIDLQGCMAVVASRADPFSLRPRRPGATTGGSLMEKWCSSTR